MEPPPLRNSPTARKAESELRKYQREARKREAELKAQLKQLEKLNQAEQARLEVESYENALEILLSVHKECNSPMDWKSLAFSLCPHPPARFSVHELAANARVSESETAPSERAIREAQERDQADFESSWSKYQERYLEWARMKNLAERVLLGDPKGYADAINEFSVFSEIPHLGSSLHLTVHSAELIECAINVNGRTAVPKETKSLLNSGKVSAKAMPRAKFHEIYQDYVCGCVLRAGREILALLPIKTVIVTAMVSSVDTATGQDTEVPVVSVAIFRTTIDGMDFERLDPSDSMENFPHRGDVLSSRKSGEFIPITPLQAADFDSPVAGKAADLDAHLQEARELRKVLVEKIKALTPKAKQSAEMIT